MKSPIPSSLDRPSVLVVDDDRSMIKVAAISLDIGDYHLYEAENGAVAVEMFNQHHPDIVLLDAFMPVMDGAEACRRIKKIDPMVPVIIITVKDDEQTVHRVFDAGADEFITKPVNWTILNRRINILLENRASMASLQIASKVMASIQDGMIVVDHDKRPITVNRAFTKITGYSLEDIKRDASWFCQECTQPTIMDQLNEKGSWEGEVSGRRKNGEIYPEERLISVIRDEQNQIHHYVVIIRDITERKRNEDMILYQANYDSLTDLPNRTLLRDRICEALSLAKREEHHVAVLFIDLDGFKAINDNYGHDAGDQLLIQTSRRLLSCIREIDTAARQGGDEFVIVLQQLRDKQGVEKVAQKILISLSLPFHLEGAPQVKISASIGAAFFPEQGEDIDEVMNNADHAMYHAKKSGKNRAAFINEDGSCYLL